MKIIYFSLYAPWENGEDFIKNEIDVLSNVHSLDIVQIPLKSDLSKKPNDTSHTVDLGLSKALNKSKSKKLLYLFSPLVWWTCFKSIPKDKPKTFKVMRLMFDDYVRGSIARKWAKNHLQNVELIYSFWLTNEFLWITKGLKENSLGLKSVSRAHRFDLYQNTQQHGFFPFRESLLPHLDLLLAASTDAFTYMQTHFSAANKIELLHLGIFLPSEFLTNKTEDNTKIRIVSCSFVKPVKRVQLIAERIREFAHVNPAINIEWTHFGFQKDTSNPENQIIENTIRKFPDNATALLKGITPNKELLNYYQNNWIDVFINLSSSEGQPVSLMEALSYGITCIATNTGGSGEIVTSDTGALLEVEHSQESFNQALNAIINNPNRRVNARQIVERNHNIYLQTEKLKKIFYDFCS